MRRLQLIDDLGNVHFGMNAPGRHHRGRDQHGGDAALPQVFNRFFQRGRTKFQVRQLQGHLRQQRAEQVKQPLTTRTVGIVDRRARPVSNAVLQSLFCRRWRCAGDVSTAFERFELPDQVARAILGDRPMSNENERGFGA